MPEDQVKIKKLTGSEGATPCSDGDCYPWGTQLDIENDMIEELGVESLAVGDVVEVRGYAFVDRRSEHSDTDGSEKRMSLQLTSLKLNREKDDRVEQLYGQDS